MVESIFLTMLSIFVLVFNNGIKIQYRKKKKNATVTFPISFQAYYSPGVITGSATNDNLGVSVQTMTLSTCKFICQHTSNSWLCIGY